MKFCIGFVFLWSCYVCEIVGFDARTQKYDIVFTNQRSGAKEKAVAVFGHDVIIRVLGMAPSAK
jgi:hypothetical protein